MAEVLKGEAAMDNQLKYFVQCAHFNHSRFFNVEVLDCDDKGISVKARSPAKPGAVMVVRDIVSDAGNYPGCQPVAPIPSMATGEVTRCARMIDDNGSVSYGIGIKYLIPSV